MPARSRSEKKKKGAARLSSRTADRHKLYEISVQCPEADVRFLDRVYRNHFGRPPLSFMEDFCGTALLSATWVQSRRERLAIGVDNCQEVLDWARAHNVPALGARQKQLRLLHKSVLAVRRPRVDVRCAFNFSYCLFLERPELLSYFKVARASLGKEGLFVIDLHGGPEAHEAILERKRFPGFKYVWEQKPWNPVDGRMDCFIHFEFPDGTRLRKAFSYFWRIWELAELRDLLQDAGFGTTEVYWEGTDRETGEGNGVYIRRTKVENDPSWVAYIVACP